MSNFIENKSMIDSVEEEKWFDIYDKIKGLSKEKIELPDDHYITQGFSCLTPNVQKNGEKIWVKPEDWEKLIQSVKLLKNIESKENEVVEFTKILLNSKKIISIKDKLDIIELSFKRNWILKTSFVNFVMHSVFCINYNKKEYLKYSKMNAKKGQDEKVLKEFIQSISPDEKWKKIVDLWETRVHSKWESIVLNIPESQRGEWYEWVKKEWSFVTWTENEEKIVDKMELSLLNKQKLYEVGKEKLKKRLEILNTENLLNFEHFEDHFFSAREKNREIIFFMGPPNTGKTYSSFNLLSEAKDGSYLAPLRLLALEGHETLLDRGVLNNLITGEERKYSKGGRHVSSTVEMANFSKPLDVAIIDEIQLLKDKDRGWAFTNAFVGIPSDKVVLTGSKDALPYVQKMSEYLGEKLIINELKSDRKLKIEKSLGQNFKLLKEGDALIAFSRRDVLSWKEGLERKGFTVSVIYGHLSPEVRREESRKFREGESQILVSTDAIGLGLNLPIRRIIFTSLEKFDGTIDRMLKPSEAWQIANRAGRKGLMESGSVTTWFSEDEDSLTMLLNTEDEPPKEIKWWVQPRPEQVELWNKKLGGSLAQNLELFSNKLLQGHSVFKPSPMEAAIARADKMKYLRLPIVDLYSYATAPIDKDDLESEMKLLEWAYIHSTGKSIKWSDVKYLWLEKSNYHSKGEALLDIEKKVRLLTVYRWLTLRFPDIYYGKNEAVMEHAHLNTKIEKYLIEIVKRREEIGKGKSSYVNKNSTFV